MLLPQMANLFRVCLGSTCELLERNQIFELRGCSANGIYTKPPTHEHRDGVPIAV